MVTYVRVPPLPNSHIVSMILLPSRHGQVHDANANNDMRIPSSSTHSSGYESRTCSDNQAPQTYGTRSKHIACPSQRDRHPGRPPLYSNTVEASGSISPFQRQWKSEYAGDIGGHPITMDVEPHQQPWPLGVLKLASRALSNTHIWPAKHRYGARTSNGFKGHPPIWG